jgi:hypothetical protein
MPKTILVACGGSAARAAGTAVTALSTFAGSQAVLYLTRARGFFWAKPRPSRMLNATTMGSSVS